MTTTFKNNISANIGTVETTVLTSSALAKTTVIGFSVTNITNSVVLVSVRIEDTVTSTIGYYVKEVILAPNQSLRLVTNGEKLILGPSSNIKVTANIASSIDVMVSYVEIL